MFLSLVFYMTYLGDTELMSLWCPVVTVVTATDYRVHRVLLASTGYWLVPPPLQSLMLLSSQSSCRTTKHSTATARIYVGKKDLLYN
jgi:hypothetical protein